MCPGGNWIAIARDGDVFAEVVYLRVYAKFPLITLSKTRVVEEVIYWEIVRAQIAI